jgi:hypothetical protein
VQDFSMTQLPLLLLLLLRQLDQVDHLLRHPSD